MQLYCIIVGEAASEDVYANSCTLHYNKMVILYGKVRATENYSVTSSEWIIRSNSIASEDFTDTPYDIDPTISQFSVQNTPYSVDDDMGMMPPSPTEHVSPSPHGVVMATITLEILLKKGKRLFSMGWKMQ